MNPITEFVFAALLQQGALIEDAGFGNYNVMLPDELAELLAIDPFVTLSFDESDTDDTLNLHYGHPVVEALIDLCRSISTPTHLYATNLNLNKSSLGQLAIKMISLPKKERLSLVRGAVESIEVFHYIRFNFRAAIVSDEKHEHLVSAILSAQTGEAVADDRFEKAFAFHIEPDWQEAPNAPVRWLKNANPLSEVCITALLDRAVVAALQSLHPLLDPIQRRSTRYLQLDQARLEGYYADLQQDLENRLARADDANRVQSLQNKIAAIKSEQEAKFGDVVAKYQMRVHLELINIMIIEQPKVVLPMMVEHGKLKIPTQVVWNTLTYVLEPLHYQQNSH